MKLYRILLFITLILASCVGGEDASEALDDQFDSTINNTSSGSTSGGSSGSVNTNPISFDGIDSAAAVSNNSIHVKFPSATGGSGSFFYRIYLNGNLSSVYQTASGITQDENGLNQYLVTGLSTGTTYSLTVRAYDGTNEDSNIKSVDEATLPTETPSFAGIKTIQALPGLTGQTQLSITWDAATPNSGNTIAQYRVFVATTTAAIDYNSPTATVSGSSTAANLTGLTAGTQYFVALRAVNNNGNVEQNTKKLSATTNTSAAISFTGVSSVTPAAGTDGFTGISIYWNTGSGDFDEYQVFVSTSDPSGLADGDGFWNTPTQTISNTSTNSTSITSLTYNTTYYVVVRARNSGDSSTDGNKIARSTSTNPDLPIFDGVQSVSKVAGVNGLTRLTVNWNTAYGAFNKYYVYKRESTGSYDFNTPETILGSNATSTTISSLTTDTTYCFVVRAVYDGVSPVHQETNTDEKCNTPEYTAPLFNGISGCSQGSGSPASSLDLNWDAASGIYDNYKVWIDTGAIDFNTPEDATLASNLTSTTILNLLANTTYNVGVRACYTGNSQCDGNTSTYSCTTDQASLNFTTTTNGYVNSSDSFITNTTVCVQDSNGSNVPYVGNITLSLQTGAGTLGVTSGSLTKAVSNSCVTFDNLTYDTTDSIVFQAVAANVTTGYSNPIVIYEESAPTNPCSVENAYYTTGYGGCTHPANSLVFSTPTPGTDAWANSLFEVPDDSLVATGNIKLHHFHSDGDGDGKADNYDPATTGTLVSTNTNEYCSSLQESGYQDWRRPTLSELQYMHGIPGYYYQPFNGTSIHNRWIFVAYNPDTEITIFRMNYNQTSTTQSNYYTFCVREIESAFTTPSMGDVLNVTNNSTLPASRVDLSWSNATTTGDYDGYYIYYAESNTGIDYNSPPQVKVFKTKTSHTITGLKPGTSYDFAIRAAWERRVIPVTDSNTYQETITTGNAYLDITLEADPLLTSNQLPIIIKVKDSSNDAVVDTNSLDITIAKVAGSGTLTGTLTKATSAGVASFSPGFSDLSGSGTIQYQASADNVTSVTSSLRTIAATSDSSCLDFTETIYPKHGGCYDSVSNVVVSRLNPSPESRFYEIVWVSGAAPAYALKDSDDTEQGNYPGYYNDADPDSPVYTASATSLSPGIETFCHSLTDGGKTDWKLGRRSEIRNVLGNGIHNYSSFSSMPSTTYYRSGYQLGTHNRYSVIIRASTLAESSSEGAYEYFCTRVPQ